MDEAKLKEDGAVVVMAETKALVEGVGGAWTKSGVAGPADASPPGGSPLGASTAKNPGWSDWKSDGGF